MRKEINRSQELVVLLTPISADRTWVKLEVGAAWGKGSRMRIVMVMCHVDVDPIPDMLKQKKAISLNEFDHYLDELTQRVRGRREED